MTVFRRANDYEREKKARERQHIRKCDEHFSDFSDAMSGANFKNATNRKFDRSTSGFDHFVFGAKTAIWQWPEFVLDLRLFPEITETRIMVAF